MQYKIKSQLYADAEAQLKGSKQILDDCTWSSCAAAVSWASKYTVDFTAAQGVAAFEKATGRKDKQGVNDAGGSLAEAAKTVAVLGGKARYAKSWADAMTAANGGAALLIWVQQPVGYPADVHISKWHDNWKKYWAKTDPAHLAAGYGHMTSAGWCADHGWQWACPTRDEKVAAEAFGVPVTEAQLRQIANSKVKAKKVAADYKCVLIVTYPVKATVTPAPAAPVVAQKNAPVKTATVKAAPVSAVDAELAALKHADWGKIGADALHLAGDAALAASKENTTMGKLKTWVKFVIDNSKMDEMLLDAVRTFLTVSISVALGLGIPLLDITSGDFRTVLSAGLASALGVLVKFLDPQNTAYGIQKKK